MVGRPRCGLSSMRPTFPTDGWGEGLFNRVSGMKRQSSAKTQIPESHFARVAALAKLWGVGSSQVLRKAIEIGIRALEQGDPKDFDGVSFGELTPCEYREEYKEED